jgi:2-polyprenyl-6-methoxyphenol hydroxylase-like FAD-dependent oxidoreductase
MKNAVKIAIIGCGTAGLAAASFLQRSGHHI